MLAHGCDACGRAADELSARVAQCVSGVGVLQASRCCPRWVDGTRDESLLGAATSAGTPGARGWTFTPVTSGREYLTQPRRARQQPGRLCRPPRAWRRPAPRVEPGAARLDLVQRIASSWEESTGFHRELDGTVWKPRCQGAAKVSIPNNSNTLVIFFS